MKYLGWAFPLGNFMFINMLFILGLFFSFLYELWNWFVKIHKKSCWGFLFEFYWIVNLLRGELTFILLLNFPIFENGLSIYSGLILCFLKVLSKTGSKVSTEKHTSFFLALFLSLPLSLSCHACRETWFRRTGSQNKRHSRNVRGISLL